MAWFFLVDFPQKAKFLEEEERVHVVERLNKDRGDGDHDQITGRKILLHLSDWKLWGFALIVSSHPQSHPHTLSSDPISSPRDLTGTSSSRPLHHATHSHTSSQ